MTPSCNRELTRLTFVIVIELAVAKASPVVRFVLPELVCELLPVFAEAEAMAVFVAVLLFVIFPEIAAVVGVMFGGTISPDPLVTLLVFTLIAELIVFAFTIESVSALLVAGPVFMLVFPELLATGVGVGLGDTWSEVLIEGVEVGEGVIDDVGWALTSCVGVREIDGVGVRVATISLCPDVVASSANAFIWTTWHKKKPIKATKTRFRIFIAFIFICVLSP